MVKMDCKRPPFYLPVYFTFLAVIVALLAPSKAFSVFRDPTQRLFSGIASSTTRHLITNKMGSIQTPVYFFSHGGVRNHFMKIFYHIVYSITAKYHV
jgi:hypothetical protein